MLRRFFYRQHIFSSQAFPIPVIIVGNISVGGNGKTPLVMHLVESLRQKGYLPGVASRGYGANNPDLKNGKEVLVDISQDVSLFGDEPWMIAACTDVPVVVGTNRVRAVEKLIQEYNCNIVVSDDGMQHYAMQRDYEICVVDGYKLFGNQFCLPAGPLRERTSRLSQVDLIVYNGTSKDSQTTYPDKSCFMQLSR